VFEQHGAFACRVLRSLGVQEADLDDMLQEVFLVVCRRQDDYEEQGRARSWLYSICRRVATSQHRRYSRDRELLAAQLSEPAVPPTQLEHVQGREALELAYRLLNQLPPKQRQIFLLYEVEDMSMPEIARLLGCPLQTAYSRLHKARSTIVRQRTPGLARTHANRARTAAPSTLNDAVRGKSSSTNRQATGMWVA
jgi:RNA polymerase sigma-70 factor, ECF subfamily